MLRRVKFLVAPVLAFVLLATNLYVLSIHSGSTPSAHAHNWDGYHWNKGGSAIYIYQSWHGGIRRAQADAARNDAWSKITPLYNYWCGAGAHCDVSVWDANYGATGWGGLASLENLDWDWGCWCYRHISHGHARVNTYYGANDLYWIQGVFCQEVFHTYGFAHDAYGGCMGLGYYSGQSNVLVSHNNNDFIGRYWNH